MTQILPNEMHGRFLHRGISVPIGQFQNPTNRIHIHIRKQDLTTDPLQNLHLVGIRYGIEATSGVQAYVSAEPSVEIRDEGAQSLVFLQRRIEADLGSFGGFEHSPEDRGPGGEDKLVGVDDIIPRAKINVSEKLVLECITENIYKHRIR